LVATADGDVVHHLVGASRQPGRDVAGLLCLDGTRHRAGEYYAVTDTFDLDSGEGLLERGAHAIEVPLDGEVIGGNLLAVGIEEHHVGLPDRLADNVGALRGADDGVGDLRIGDQHILDVARQVDHDRFADAKRDKAGFCRRDGGDRYCPHIVIGVGRHHRR
jgi:hypothetical protein